MDCGIRVHTEVDDMPFDGFRTLFCEQVLELHLDGLLERLVERLHGSGLQCLICYYCYAGLEPVVFLGLCFHELHHLCFESLQQHSIGGDLLCPRCRSPIAHAAPVILPSTIPAREEDSDTDITILAADPRLHHPTPCDRCSRLFGNPELIFVLLDCTHRFDQFCWEFVVLDGICPRCHSSIGDPPLFFENVLYEPEEPLRWVGVVDWEVSSEDGANTISASRSRVDREFVDTEMDVQYMGVLPTAHVDAGVLLDALSDHIHGTGEVDDEWP